jgi:hypothetical protein
MVGLLGTAEPAHDPEKWTPVFPRDKRGTRLRGDHANSKTWSAMIFQPNLIAIQGTKTYHRLHICASLAPPHPSHTSSKELEDDGNRNVGSALIPIHQKPTGDCHGCESEACS